MNCMLKIILQYPTAMRKFSVRKVIYYKGTIMLLYLSTIQTWYTVTCSDKLIQSVSFMDMLGGSVTCNKKSQTQCTLLPAVNNNRGH